MIIEALIYGLDDNPFFRAKVCFMRRDKEPVYFELYRWVPMWWSFILMLGFAAEAWVEYESYY